MISLNSENHHSIDDFNDVHSRLESKIKFYLATKNDENKAKEIEKFLRELKRATSMQKTINNNAIASTFETMAYEDLIEIATSATNIMKSGRGSRSRLSINTLFNRSHSKQDSKKTTLDVDDVFEEEFAAVLSALAGKATKGKDYNLGLSITGQSLAINRDFSKMSDKILKETLDEIRQDLIAHGYSRVAADSELAKIQTQAKSGKVDINGFTLEFDGELDPKYANLINILSGVSFSLKNYSSGSLSTTIHLGRTVPFKSITSTLDDLGYSRNEALHIFYHARGSDKAHHSAELQTHVFHTRLYYELMGVGLYDMEGTPLTGVDFLIYNDPSSENIFVRSTRKIIYDLVFNSDKQTQFSGNAFASGISIKKSYF